MINYWHEEPSNTLTTPTCVVSTMDIVWLKKRFLTKFRSANFVQSSDGAHIHCVGNCRYYDISTESAKKRASFWTRSRDISSLALANAVNVKPEYKPHLYPETFTKYIK